MTRQLPLEFSYQKAKGLQAGRAGQTLVLGVSHEKSDAKGDQGSGSSVPKVVRTTKELEGAYGILTKLPHFTGKHESVVAVYNQGAALQGIGGYATLLGVGIGGTGQCVPQLLLSLGGKIAQELKAGKTTEADVHLESLYTPAASVDGPDAPKDFAGRPLLEAIPTREEALENIALGMILGSYTFDRYKRGKDDAKKKEKDVPLKVRFVSSVLDPRKVAAILEKVDSLARAVYIVRDLQTTPGGDMTPADIARNAQQAGREAGFDVTVWDEKKLKAENFNGVLAVGQGSSNPPRFIIMEHNKGKKNLPTVVFVGKGVSFDTGGICIKPAPGMEEMKMDMSGAASVVGAMYALAKLGAPVHAVGLIPSAENMINGNATRPGDIYTAHDGTTVEVINTDAEGRLVLADALSYAKNYEPDCVIDIATLTGAVVIGLGHVASGLMGNNGALIDGFKRASNVAGERVWELPLYQEYQDDMKAKIADLRNIGSDRSGGSQKGGAFLNHFVNGNYPWIHLDVAGTADTPKGQGAHCPPHVGTAVPTRALVEFASNLKTYFGTKKSK